VAGEGLPLDYQVLVERACRVGARLRGLGAGPEALVALVLPRSAELVACQLGVLFAGAAFLPLDPAMPDERLRSVLTDAGVVAAIGPEARVRHLVPAGVPVLAPAAALAEERARFEPAAVRPGQLAYVIYTSGSTGQPKGVAVDHLSLANLVDWHLRHFNVTARDRATLLAGPGFDASVWEIWPYLAAGASLHVPDEETRLSAPALAAWLTGRGITIGYAPTPLAELLIQEAWPAPCPLRALLTGGEALRSRPPADLPFRLHNNYGLTESTVVASSGEVSSPTRPNERLPSIGWPIDNTALYVLDEALAPVPPGLVGELYIGGAALARGYHRQPGMTAERFIPDPFGAPGGRLYKTGDLVRRLADGDLHYVGRNDKQVKVHGHRVELAEIERALCALPEVVTAVADVVAEPGRREGRLVAWVVPRDSSAPRLDVAKRRLKNTLPDYMIPAVLVPVPSLPLTPNGKVDRGRLPPPPVAEEAEEPPADAVEERLIGLWRECLNVDRVGRRANFFDLGGYSLLGARLFARVRESFGVSLPLQTMFAAPTVAEMAVLVRSGQGARPDEVPRRTYPQHGYRLSFAQERLHITDALLPNRAVYNVPVAVRLRGELSEPSLREALNRIVRRHAVLRVHFGAAEDGTLLQFDGGWNEAPWASEAHAGLSPAQRDEAVKVALQDEWARPFRLDAGPLIRIRLLTFAPDDHALVLCLHHIVTDGQSLALLLGELADHYRDARGGRPESPLEGPDYLDYAGWQRQRLRGEAVAADMGYWKQRLEEAPQSLTLPTDRTRPAASTFRGGSVPFTVDGPLSAAVAAAAQTHDCTPFVVFLAAYASLLARYSGQNDLVVGTAVANRSAPGTEDMLGLFVNTIALRLRAEPGTSFAGLLAALRQALAEALAHQALPFELVIEAVRPERGLSHNPLFQVFFNYLAGPLPALDLDGARGEPVEPALTTAKFDLSLTVTRQDGTHAGYWNYSADLFDEATVERMRSQYLALLRDATAHPGRPVAQLSLLDEREAKALLHDWNDTARPLLGGGLVHRAVERTAARHPDTLAVVHGDQALTYSQLDAKADRLASRLRASGVRPHSFVGISLEPSADLIVAVLGALKAGCAYVPLDPAFPRERLAGMLADAPVRCVLTLARLRPVLPTGDVPLICLDEPGPEEAERPEVREATDAALAAVGRIYAIFTSGSTGRPKLAAVYHRGFAALVDWYIRDYAMTQADRVLLVSSFNFDLTQKAIFAPLMTGGCLHLPEQSGYDPVALRRQIEAERITLVTCTPSAFYPLVEEGEEAALAQLRSLRHVFLGGEPIAASRLRRWASSPQFHAEIVNTYGPTECSDIVASYRLRDLASPQDGPVPIGRPIPNARLYVLGPGLELLPIGAVGELCIGGAGVGQGYLNDTALTADRFVPDPFGPEPGARLYRSGDLARFLPDGNLVFLGRRDFQVKVRGFRIEFGEIDAALQAHPAVRAAVTTALEGPGRDKALASYVVRRADTTTAELKGWLRCRLPEYMVPSFVVFLEALPLSPNGKVDRKALPRPEVGAADRELTPRNETEARVQEIWGALFDGRRVGIHEDFFDVGGHSVLAAQLLGRINAALGVALSLRDVFTQRTVAGQAELIARQSARPAEAPARITRAARKKFQGP
jgi:amino acid adenylation domain-containing protein